MTVEISAPIESQGTVLGLVSKRTGQIKSMEALVDWTTIVAEVSRNYFHFPLSFWYRTYIAELRAEIHSHIS